MRTLVLIPAYNEEKNLERVIENLKKKAPQFDYIIINDGSTDHTEKLCRKKQYHYISLPVGFRISLLIQSILSVITHNWVMTKNNLTLIIR